MEKNWLIRTKSNHILGPVSKEKALELYNNGSIKGDDELCSGNGYWFYVREDDLVNRYLKGNEQQSFNPISEAKDVLTQSSVSNHTLDQSQDEITLIGNVNLNQLRGEKKSENLAEVKPIRPEPALSAHIAEGTPKKKNKSEKVAKPATSPREKKVHKGQSFLQYLVIFGFILLFCVVYFRKNLIRAIFSSASTVSSFIVPSAHAQEVVAPVKKKSF